MLIAPAAPPQSVPVYGGFDYVTVDTVHRRVYAAHTSSNALLVVDADTGKVIGQVPVGAMHGVAFNPMTGVVYTGNGSDKSVSEVDPKSLRVTRSVDVAGEIDAIAFDPANGHIYADEDNGTRIFVIDAKTMKQIAVITIPGHKPEYLAVDPQTHAVYQNIADSAEITVIDGNSLAVSKHIPTPGMKNSHPLQYDAKLKEIVAIGKNGVMHVYAPDGTKKFAAVAPKGIDQCDLNARTHQLACASDGQITIFALSSNAAPKKLGSIQVAPDVHTVAFDAKTNSVWTVWSSAKGDGDFVQRFTVTP